MAGNAVRAVRIVLAGVAIVWLGASSVDAQWPSYPWKNVPRTKDGKIDMNAPPPRTADGHPDLSGFWMPGATIRDQVKWLLNFAADMKPEEIPLQPWARQLYNERIENNGKDHPGVRCWPSGIPEKLTIPDGLKLIHTPDVMLFLHESRTIYRQVFTDGRKLPTPEQAQPMWMGYSIGHWEGDTFVATTVMQNGKTWLDMRGLPGTESLKVTERYTRPSMGRMNIRVTIDDPKAYTRPWTVNVNQHLALDTDLLEYACLENEKDVPHLVGK
jgi:hypothetical protein